MIEMLDSPVTLEKRDTGHYMLLQGPLFASTGATALGLKLLGVEVTLKLFVPLTVTMGTYLLLCVPTVLPSASTRQ